MRFSIVDVPSFRFFRGSYRRVRIALSVAVADGLMPRKVLGRQKGVCQAYLAKGKQKPLGLSVGGLFTYRHAPESLGSRTPWNKSSAYVLYTHYKSEIFKSVILSVLYHIRHFKTARKNRPVNRQKSIYRSIILYFIKFFVLISRSKKRVCR